MRAALLGGPILAGLVLAMAWHAVPAMLRAGEADRRRPSAKDAVTPIAPLIPAELVASLQASRYGEAAGRLATLAGDAKLDAATRSYYRLVQGVALRLDGKLDEARAALDAGVTLDPVGPWIPKLRSELAAVAVAGGKFSDAEAIARTEADRLLGGDRKDALAQVYRDFASRLLDPEQPTVAADPEGAYALLAQAFELAQGARLRAELKLAQGRASQKAGNHPRAIGDFEAYLKLAPEGSDRDAARFALAESQLAAGNPLAARLTWTDLARGLERSDRKEARDLRARALFQIARTYGFPNPPDDTTLNLGTASLRRLLEAYPAHPQAVRAAYEIGAAARSRGQAEAALTALRAFLAGQGYRAETESARRDEAELKMAAQFAIGEILQGQQKFPEAIEAFKAYLAAYPNGPQSADAQRALVDTELLIAQERLGREDYAGARAAWDTFVTRNPLDPRVPQVLFDRGASFQSEKLWDQAIAAWETLAGKFPGTEPAAHAQFQAALVVETEKAQPAEAIERYRKISVEPWAAQARQRVAAMEAKNLAVVTPRTFRSGEVPQLKITTRNLESLTFTAYRLDAEAYFRKKQEIRGVEALDIGLVQPDAEWKVEVPGYQKYSPIEHTYDLAKLETPGVYVVKVTDEKTLQATSLVLSADLDAIVKVSRDQLLCFVQDMKTGQGRPNARVLVSDGSTVIHEGKTGPDGVLLASWKNPLAPGTALRYLILDGAHVAGTALGVPGQVAQGLSPRAYLYTDRPAYRPGQSVALKGVVREVQDGKYSLEKGAAYKLEIFDSRGRQFFARGVNLSEFGTFALDVPLDSSAPVGNYRVRLYQPGHSDFNGQFVVRAYQLQKLDLEIDLPRTVYFRGETIEGKVVARYQYGTPLVGHPVQVQLPDGRVLSGTTDAVGLFPFSVPTEGFAEEQLLPIAARLPQDDVATQAGVQLAVRAFRIELNTARTVYLDGESFPLEVRTADPLGKPTAEALTVSVLKRVEQAGRLTERQVQQEAVRTDARTGQAVLPLRIDDKQGGSYIIRVAGTDRFGNPIVEDRALSISGREDAEKLRLLADRLTFRVGETARLNLVNRTEAGPALLTWEADRVLKYQIVPLREGENALSWEVDGDQFPNFTLTAARMAGTGFHQAQLNLQVDRGLRVEIVPKKPVVGPGEEVEVEVRTRDQLDRPVSAELSLALIDRALLRLAADPLPPIDRFFYDQSRTAAFSTQATNTFRYDPPTQPVSAALVEEQERLLAQEADQLARREVLAGAVADRAELAELSAASRPARDAKAKAGRAMGGFGGGGRGEPFGYAAPAAVAASPAPREVALDAEMAEPPPGADDAPAGEAGLEFRSQSQRFRRGMADAAKPGDRGGEPEAPRQKFVETAYWNPSVVTSKEGRALVKFRAPTALSEYRFTARGITGLDTLAGQSQADLAIRQNFFVDLKTPAILTEGDKPRFSAEVHHQGLKGQAEVRLTVYAAGREQVLVKTIPVEGDGITPVLFEPFEVPAGDQVRLTLAAKVGEQSDSLVLQLPTRPWGVQAMATAAGTARDDTTVFVELPPGRPYESPELMLVLSPRLQRLVVELALGREFYPMPRYLERCILPPPSNTLGDRASDLIAAAAALEYLRTAGGAQAPEAGRLTERIRSLVAELVTAQNDDGGWPWVSPTEPGKTVPSDRPTSAHALWALKQAWNLGLVTDPQTVERAAAYLTQELARLEAGDRDTRAAVLHALSAFGKASFEQANSLNRNRQELSDTALAYLALTFANLDRRTLGAEVLAVLGPRAKSEPVGPGLRPRRYWDGGGLHPWFRTPAETTGLAALAYARISPDDPILEPAIDWLLAHRIGTDWRPHKAKGPAVAAIAAVSGRAREANDAYDLVVTVNNHEVFRKRIEGPAEGSVVQVPLEHIKTTGPNRIQFDLEGRGTFGYSALLSGFARDFGPDQDATGKPFAIRRRVTLAADPELDGKPLPTGFAVAVQAEPFENKVSQVALGGRTRVELDAYRIQPAGQPAWEREFLVLEDRLPAGATLVEGSVQSPASSFEVVDGAIRFYFAPDQWPGTIRYDLYGYLPGAYRTLPPQISSAYDPGRSHLGPADSLTVLQAGERSTDPYRPTPDELYARGKGLFDAGQIAEAGAPLEALWSGYTLRDDVAKDAARMLLQAQIQAQDARKIVKYFEILKEKSPELVIPFSDIQVIGRAYSELGEHERAYLVWRATAEASYLEDARLGEVLRQRGQNLEGLALLLQLWREYPGSASLQSDFFGLSQVLASLATRAIDDPAVRRELAAASVTRSDLLNQEIRLIGVFLSLSPRDPIADEASLALVGAYLEREDFEQVVGLAERFAGLYPRSRYLDSFQYSAVLGLFHLGRYDAAVGLAEKIAAAVYKDANGVDQASPNKWQALYILGQIFDARRQPGRAIPFYEQVADRFSEAASAVRDLNRKALTLPEVATLRPTADGKIVRAVEPAAGGVTAGSTGAAAGPQRPAGGAGAEVALSYRNVTDVDLKVYSVDLMQLYLTRRNLDAITGIDLAGIRPLEERTVPLGDGKDYQAKVRDLALPLSKEGAYLVMARGGDLYTSGIVLVSPLELQVYEEPDAGRVRVRVIDARTGDPVPKTQVKVIGSANGQFLSGETDLRGVFVTEGVQGEVTAVARRGTNQYAFYRGTTRLGAPVPASNGPGGVPGQPGQPSSGATGGQQGLQDNLRSLNTSNQFRQLDRLQQRYNSAPSQGVQVDKATDHPQP